jgi:3-methyladenine DNA glycosylase/8-oxoguanine DNA glycosylase
VIETLVPAILGQKVLGKEASYSLLRLTQAFGEPAPGPDGLDLWLIPAPETLAGLGYEQYHPFGVERRRAELIRTVARRHRRLEQTLELDGENARRRLGSIPGIGPWTTALVMRVAHGDADAVPVGDYHLPALVAWNLTGKRRADDERMLELLEPYRGHRARVLQLLHLEGDQPPRRGPRLPFRSIERS